MLELLLATFIVSQCGNEDFKTREYFTYHVRKDFNYYYVPILLNKNDPEIYRRMHGFENAYWEKVAKEFKDYQLSHIRYVPWIGEKEEQFNYMEWINLAKNRYKIDDVRDHIAYRYATVLFCEEVIKQEGYRGCERLKDLLDKWWQEEDEWAEKQNYKRARKLDYRIPSESIEPPIINFAEKVDNQ